MMIVVYCLVMKVILVKEVMSCDVLPVVMFVFTLELQTFKILAAERLRLIKLGTRLIADYFQHTVNILKKDKAEHFHS